MAMPNLSRLWRRLFTPWGVVAMATYTTKIDRWDNPVQHIVLFEQAGERRRARVGFSSETGKACAALHGQSQSDQARWVAFGTLPSYAERPFALPLRFKVIEGGRN